MRTNPFHHAWLLSTSVSLICYLELSISTPPGLIGAQHDLSTIASPVHGVSNDRLEGLQHLDPQSSIQILDFSTDGFENSEQWYKRLVLEDHGIGQTPQFWDEVFGDEFRRNPEEARTR
ncbi:hypothetical protein PCANC_21484 [Puccinia coronata f. sp. avenae]|uniref:Uncharacterized protein n=1 Tax=Puccinia coronata f. sp. avenae TaxID=200324 RepID=A0A2N5U068_9BASI|nr:hypothetical protein PCANC_21484 [Puccinia coronata f. sp. avenae]